MNEVQAEKHYIVKSTGRESPMTMERMCNEMWETGYRLVTATLIRNEGSESHLLYFEKVDH